MNHFVYIQTDLLCKTGDLLGVHHNKNRMCLWFLVFLAWMKIFIMTDKEDDGFSSTFWSLVKTWQKLHCIEPVLLTYLRNLVSSNTKTVRLRMNLNWNFTEDSWALRESKIMPWTRQQVLYTCINRPNLFLHIFNQ